MIFRFDDICSNTDFENYKNLVSIIKSFFEDAVFVSGVTLFCKDNLKDTGQVYDGEVPFKNRENKFFYDVNEYFNNWAEKIIGKVASHGFVHMDHSKISKDAQEMSIITSCEFLGSTVFIPPFNRFNEDTIKICKDNCIKLVGHGERWHGCEFQRFDEHFRLWYLHPWRWTPEKLKGYLSGIKEEVVG